MEDCTAYCINPMELDSMYWSINRPDIPHHESTVKALMQSKYYSLSCYSTSVMKWCFVILSFCLCESHDVYFLYYFTPSYMYSFLFIFQLCYELVVAAALGYFM